MELLLPPALVHLLYIGDTLKCTRYFSRTLFYLFNSSYFLSLKILKNQRKYKSKLIIIDK